MTDYERDFNKVQEEIQEDLAVFGEIKQEPGSNLLNLEDFGRL